ncbi:Tim44 domain-containing protein [Halopseudomonas yangmingensis]|uniref:Predicted lipid-binding transport protein, Tim44 family n=1 Tax=Halopseudomonas yangmingensis TaxID=1720063 RepID=A0A1I4P5I0_9GAMM|nr:hypothetical protein [Halopseudomonas yangmingensis]SFM22623.1 Predicted lipid-binding transport protein, Tim44 family [Halopseudomonas yangmingensis]
MRWFVPLFSIMLMIGFTIPDAEARRMGGGKSFGSAPAQQAPAQRQQAPRQQPTRQQTQPAAANSGASRWLGPLAGIAAGGLLASMLFGDGFEGIQLFDILLFGLIAFVLFRLLRGRRPAMQSAVAGGAPSGYWQPEPAMQRTAEPLMTDAANVPEQPSWFDQERFLAAAEEHFYTLQRHWRDNDRAGMAEYMSGELLQAMLRERDSNPPSASGFVEQLSVQLDAVEEDSAGNAVASISFRGLDHDEAGDTGQWFEESWRLERDAGDNQPWIITGIRQNG